MESISSFKYLGFTLSNDLTWHVNVSSLLASASKTLGYLKHQLCLAPCHMKLLVYRSLVRPELEYASTISKLHHVMLITNIEAVQNHVARFIHSYLYDVDI